MTNAEHLMTLTKLGHRDENKRRTRPASQQMPVNKYTKFFLNSIIWLIGIHRLFLFNFLFCIMFKRRQKGNYTTHNSFPRLKD